MVHDLALLWYAQSGYQLAHKSTLERLSGNRIENVGRDIDQNLRGAGPRNPRHLHPAAAGEPPCRGQPLASAASTVRSRVGHTVFRLDYTMLAPRPARLLLAAMPRTAPGGAITAARRILQRDMPSLAIRLIAGGRSCRCVGSLMGMYDEV